MAGLDPLELYTITKVLSSPSSPSVLHFSVYGQSFSSPFLGVSPRGHPSLLQMPAFSVCQRKIEQIEHFQPGKLGQMGNFGRQLWAIWTSWIRSKAEPVTSIVCLVPFYAFFFGSVLLLDAHPVTQPLQVASACPRCNTCHV